VAAGTNARVTAACSEAAIGSAKGYRSGVEMAKSTITARIPMVSGNHKCKGYKELLSYSHCSLIVRNRY
jgi:hypothetical protein